MRFPVISRRCIKPERRGTYSASKAAPTTLKSCAVDLTSSTGRRGSTQQSTFGHKSRRDKVFTNEMLLPLPSYLAAVVEATGVLLLLSHPQHAHASAVIGAFAILALCETMFALQAVDDEQCTEAHRRLTTFLCTVIGWCLAAMPLAVALFVQGRAAPESDSLARAALLVRLKQRPTVYSPACPSPEPSVI